MTVNETQTIAIIDDENDIRGALRQMFELEGYAVADYRGGEEALAAINAGFVGIVITDLRMPGMDGRALFNALQKLDPELPVIIMSGHGDLATAVDLVKRGAYDYLSKPFDGDHLIASVRR
ncbi:MAG: response regulator, partial [Sphingorhabdus sp.]|nr:response regulator [Sphingorhabdus sp.]